MSDSKFFTNEPDRDLYGKFQTLLKGHTNYFDILVGYFRASGFFRLCEAFEEVEKIRVLVGLNVDRLTAQIAIAAAKKNFCAAVQNEFDVSEISRDVESGTRKFIAWLKGGKIELKIYPKAPLHAKVYIMRKNSSEISGEDSVITGSSNFSEAGLKNNLEFNVELKDLADVKFCLDKFNDLWADGVPVSEEFIDTVQNRTWLRENVTPYELFLKTLAEFFKEELAVDKNSLPDDFLPDNFLRLQYQIDAVIQAKRILESYGGVFISDVVGLGKTYICAMLAKIIKGRKLIICPPVLINQWEKARRDFNIAATVESRGKLDKILAGADKFDYVFVDEAHNFRNDETESYSLLHKICYGKKVVLISATPINNYSTDIENQIALFQSKRNCTIPGIPNLKIFFDDLNRKLTATKNSAEYFFQVKRNSEEIRDKILRHVMIRRTRGEILKFYADDLQTPFPKLDTPTPIDYFFDNVINSVFVDTVNAIKNLSYARYTPANYLPKKYAASKTAQQNLKGFMKCILIKRLESSFFAFKKTLERFAKSHEEFIDMYERGTVYISKKINVYDYLDDEEKLFEIVESGNVEKIPRNEFSEKFILDLRSDLQKIQTLQERWNNISADPKLERLKKLLREVKPDKKIIFTEFKETAEYLFCELGKIFGDKIILFSGSSSRTLKEKIEKNFDPQAAAPENKFDLLISTDVLAEGVNLHRANLLINYDLPWNPTRIMQRVGRINRIGTTHDEIFVYNFFPAAETKKHLSLEERITEKLQLFHSALGEDFKYISEDENVAPQKLFSVLNAKLDDGEINPETDYLKLIRKIRAEDKKLFDRIKKLPLKARAGKFSDETDREMTLTFMRRGKLKIFYMTGEKTESLSFLDAIKYLECSSDEQAAPIGEKFFDQYKANTAAFENLFGELAVNQTGGSKDDKDILPLLKALRTVVNDSERDELDKIIAIYRRGDIPKSDLKKIRQLKENFPQQEIFGKIKKIIGEYYLRGRNNSKDDGDKEIILSCNLRSR